ncbi:MAG: hypothetical protein WBV71_13510 [Roseobacter sp.]
MIRPEAREDLMRWREALAGIAALLLGVWWLAGNSQVLVLPAVALIVLGVALIWIGVQRARFRGEGQGPGTVDVDEGQITYFGPLTGGAVAVREITRVTLDPSLHPKHWRLRQGGSPELLIPINAEGAERLFDVFATLPGLRMEQALVALKTTEKHPIVIWQRDLSISAQTALH